MNSPSNSTPDLKRVSAVAVVYNDLVLLGKRTEEWEGEPIPFGGYWSIFGGTLEEGENPLTCAVRELKEETGISAEIFDLEFLQTLYTSEPVAKAQHLNERVEFTVYRLSLSELAVPTLNEEHTECGWFKVDSLKSFTEKIDPKIVAVLTEV